MGPQAAALSSVISTMIDLKRVPTLLAEHLVDIAEAEVCFHPHARPPYGRRAVVWPQGGRREGAATGREGWPQGG